MKNLLLLFLSCMMQFLTAQEIQKKTIFDRKNEIRIDVGRLLTSSGFHIAYERFLSNDFSTGISATIYGDGKVYAFFTNSNATRDYQIEPFVRYSISKKVNKFFYVEAFSPITIGRIENIDRISNGIYAYYERNNKNFARVALGAAIGHKFYIKRQFCMDLNFGFSANIYNKADLPALPKLGIAAGYRF